MRQKNTDSLQPKFVPDYSFERDFLAQNITPVCGIDEAGRGPLAGPVVAAAVILNPDAIPDGLHDSKKLSQAKRVMLYEVILKTSHVAIASVCAKTIDRINIRAASLKAMEMACHSLDLVPAHALIDGNALPGDMPCLATALVKGDSRSVSIAAASIIAKVTRDRMMTGMDKHYPAYGFVQHKGYPTKTHRETLAQIGPCPIHRLTFAPVKSSIK